MSSGLFVVLGTAGRSARMCVCCTQWRASNLSNIFRSRYPPDSSINRSFTDIFLFRCVYRDGNGILLLHVFSLACVYFSSAKLLLRLLPLGLAAAVICFLCDADGRHEKNLTRAPKKKKPKMNALEYI